MPLTPEMVDEMSDEEVVRRLFWVVSPASLDL